MARIRPYQRLSCYLRDRKANWQSIIRDTSSVEGDDSVALLDEALNYSGPI